MLSALTLVIASIAQSPTPDPLDDPRLGPSRPAIVSERCGACGVRFAAIAATIERLQASRRDDDREDAAEILGGVRPGCHPEAVQALAGALISDPDDDVREEAAKSLDRMGACDPAAHAALNRAASDRKLAVRHRAIKALRSYPARCPADCSVCGPVAAVVQAPPRRPGMSIRVPIPGPAKRFLPTTVVNAPGVHVVVNPRRPVRVDPILIPPIVDPIVIPDAFPPVLTVDPIVIPPVIVPDPAILDPIDPLTEPRLDPIPPALPATSTTRPAPAEAIRPEDLPPPDPTPAPATRLDPLTRRTSAKPVAPIPAPVPVVEGPVRAGSLPGSIPKPSAPAPPTDLPALVPPASGPG